MFAALLRTLLSALAGKKKTVLAYRATKTHGLFFTMR